MVNIRTLAKAAGVSASTVSRALNGTVPVNEEKRKRIFDAANEFGYRTSKIVPADCDIGIIIPRFSGNDLPNHPTLYNIITAFVDELNNQGVRNSMVIIGNEDLANIRPLFEKTYSGYLILGTSQEQEDVLLLFMEAENIPCVLINRWLSDKRINYVNIDDVHASEIATEHLIAQSYKKIAFVSGDSNFRNSQLRLLGFENAMKKADFEIPKDYIVHDQYTVNSGYEAASKLLVLKEKPEAAFFTSDILAIGFQRALKERGFELPRDFGMVGYGDIQLASYVSPKLTTIRMPTEEMGRQAALSLLNLIRNPLVTSAQILLKASLVIRESVSLVQ
jgi:DNA-binding LacI/PurR family transcriptional regulator